MLILLLLLRAVLPFIKYVQSGDASANTTENALKKSKVTKEKGIFIFSVVCSEHRQR
uniref:Uncharacterized protein n=1 Tax=Anguilla anguilla TaxID=7936 RepID=A0A0E9QJ79_ANGAN